MDGHPTPTPRRGLRAALTLAAAALLLTGGVTLLEQRVEAKAQPTADARLARADLAAPRPTSYADMLEPAMAAVVNIRAEEPVRVPGRNEGGRRSPFPWFFPNPEEDPHRNLPEMPKSESAGSGVVVRSDGIILTNNHVVADADEVWVSFPDRREFRAEVIGTDPPTDIAVLQIKQGNLPTLPIGRSANLRVGDLVFAIGNPFRLAHTVTMGIVSAKGRASVGILGQGGYENFIQTDASINPGNSGGALVNARGELVGINAAIFTGGMGGNQGIGFAIPVDMVANVLDQILETGEVRRGKLGVVIQDVEPAIAKRMGLDRPRGALVAQVEGGSPADRAGIEAGDVIVALDGQAIEDMPQLRLQVSSQPPGSEVALGIVRDADQRLTKRVRLAALDGRPEEAASEEAPAIRSALRGVDVEDLDARWRERLELPRATTGVVITEVERGGPAQRAGLRPGDVILELDRQPIGSVTEYRRHLRATGTDAVFVLVRRAGSDVFVVVEP